MPDLMSHLLIGLILAELFNIKKKSIVVMGALLPDLLSKIHLIYYYFGISPFIFFSSFHTPLMMFLLSLLLAPLFIYSSSKFLISFNIGSMSHMISDLTMKHFTVSGSRLLFPFSMKNFTLNLIWPEQSIYVLIVLLMIYVGIFTVKNMGKIKFRNIISL